MLEELKALLAVVQHGTFESAGAQIGLSRSAISSRIRQLENRLGMTLFIRTGRALRLSPDAQRVVRLARQMLALADEMQKNDDTALQGHLRLGAITSVQGTLLPPVLRDMRMQAPDLHVQLIPGVSLTLLDQVDRGELDMALLIRPPFALPASLQGEVFHREPFVLITPHEVTGGDPLEILAGHPFIQYDRSSFGGRQVAGFLKRQRLAPSTVLEVDDIEAIVRMVASGLGVALVPMGGLWCRDIDRDIRVHALPSPAIERELMMVTRAPLVPGSAQALLRECLMASQDDP